MPIEDSLLLRMAEVISEQAALLDETQRTDIGHWVSDQTDPLSETQLTEIGQFAINLFANMLTEAQKEEVRVWATGWVKALSHTKTMSRISLGF